MSELISDGLPLPHSHTQADNWCCSSSRGIESSGVNECSSSCYAMPPSTRHLNLNCSRLSLSLSISDLLPRSRPVAVGTGVQGRGEAARRQAGGDGAREEQEQWSQAEGESERIRLSRGSREAQAREQNRWTTTARQQSVSERQERRPEVQGAHPKLDSRLPSSSSSTAAAAS